MSVTPQTSNYGDRLYLNSHVELLPSAARIVTTNSATQSPTTSNTFIPRGCHLIINVTALVNTPSVVPRLSGFEGTIVAIFYDLLVGNAITDITGIGTYVLKLYPGAPGIPNVCANDYLPDFWRLSMEHANADSMTYSVVAKLFE